MAPVDWLGMGIIAVWVFGVAVVATFGGRR